MKVILSKKDVKKLMFDSFTQGLNELRMNQCIIDWESETNKANYKKASEICHNELETVYPENVLVKMLEESEIIFLQEFTYKISLNLDLATKNLQEACENPWFLGEVHQIIPEYDNADVCTYNHILQGALFGNVMYG